MVEEPQDTPIEDTDHEEVVLSRWERLQKWWSMIMAIKKTVAFLAGFGAVSVAGNINDTNYWDQAACEVGLYDCIQEDVIEHSVPEEVVENTEPETHTHPHSHPHTHELEAHTHPVPVTQQELKDLIKDAISEVIPPDHMKLH